MSLVWNRGMRRRTTRLRLLEATRRQRYEEAEKVEEKNKVSRSRLQRHCLSFTADACGKQQMVSVTK
jgi:hypothetical protein